MLPLGGPGDTFVRDQFFESMFKMVEASAKVGGSARGRREASV